ncbi:MAG: hypothetical protein K2P69_12565, partial [Eubacterium sp.]|nr:hypothetical protein [Eubacterium sp.]
VVNNTDETQNTVIYRGDGSSCLQWSRIRFSGMRSENRRSVLCTIIESPNR